MKTLILATTALFLAIEGNSQIEMKSQLKFTSAKTIKLDELPKGVITNYYLHSKRNLYNKKKRKYESKYGIGRDLLGGYSITTSDNYIIIASPGFRNFPGSNGYLLFSIANEWNYRTRILDGSICSCSKLKSMNNDGTEVLNTNRELCYTSENQPIIWECGSDHKAKGVYIEKKDNYYSLYK